MELSYQSHKLKVSSIWKKEPYGRVNLGGLHTPFLIKLNYDAWTNNSPSFFFTLVQCILILSKFYYQLMH